VLLYDLRSSRPMHSKDHMYGLPIVDVKWHAGPDDARRVISADSRCVKVWDAASGAPFTSFEPEADITDVCVWPRSGLLLLATEAKRLVPAFVPALGPAPRWCAFLENLTEEMEESPQSALYDDYRFVTRAELDRVGLAEAIGTPVLRAYMHGYFIDNKLYGKAAALLAPFDYASYRAQKVREKLEAERGSRIGLQRRLPRVNAALAARLATAPAGRRRAAAAADGGDESDGGGDDFGDDLPPAARGSGGGGAAAEPEPEPPAGDGSAPSVTLLRDPRFQALFSNADYEIDEAADEYRSLHPHARSRGRGGGGDDDGDGDDGDGGGGSEPSFYAARGDVPAFGGLGGAGLAKRAQPLGERRDGGGESLGGAKKVRREGRGGGRAGGTGRGGGRGGGARGRGRGR
jgi:ribosome biogenesis protein ENP2